MFDLAQVYRTEKIPSDVKWMLTGDFESTGSGSMGFGSWVGLSSVITSETTTLGFGSDDVFDIELDRDEGADCCILSSVWSSFGDCWLIS